MTHKGWCVVKHQTNKQNKNIFAYLIIWNIKLFRNQILVLINAP